MTPSGTRVSPGASRVPFSRAQVHQYALPAPPTGRGARLDLKTALNGVAGQTDHPTDDELKAGATNRYPYKEMPELVVAVIHQRVFEAFWRTRWI